MAKTKVNWGLTALAGGTGAGWLWGRSKKKDPNSNMITPEPYAGLRPYSGADVGLGAGELQPLSQQYRSQIMERSRGEGLVGFDPKLSSLKKQNFTNELNYQDEERKRREQAQSASQGLRGGIPLDISRRRYNDYERNLTSGLNNIDIADLEANREDRNTATYAQPDLVQLGSGIQQNRANFDLAEYNAEMPTYIDQPQDNTLAALLGAAGTIGGAYVGGPGGAAGGNALAQMLLQQQQQQGGANRSLRSGYGGGDLG